MDQPTPPKAQGNLLVTDCGSTKSDWCYLYATGQTHFFQKPGLNPLFATDTELSDWLASVASEISEPHQIGKVYFYGAGCSQTEVCQRLGSRLSRMFPHAQIAVGSDLLGAALASCGKDSGLVGILGTGANACLYEGGRIAHNPPANGIWFGDEGSAGYMGKMLVADYLNEQLPPMIKAAFEAFSADKRAEILHKVYQKPYPNRYLAGFAYLIYERRAEPYFQHLVAEAMDTFFRRIIARIPGFEQHQLYLVGSTAQYFEAELREAAKRHGVSVGQIRQRPIFDLVSYLRELG